MYYKLYYINVTIIVILKAYHMSALTVRLPDDLAEEVTKRARKLHISRSQYIRKSIENMNKSLYEQERQEKLFAASMRTRTESIKINSEFSNIEHDPEN